MFHTPAEEIASELQIELGTYSVLMAVKQLPAVPTKAEVFSLLHAAQDERDHLVLRLFYATGARTAEVERIRLADVSDEGIFIRCGKEKKDRYVEVDRRTLELIEKLGRGQPPSALVCGVKSRALERIVHHYADKVGLVAKYEAMQRTFSPDSLRHAMATHCYDNGMDLFSLKKLLGHQFLDTTEIYVKTSMEKIRREYKRTHPLGRTHT